MGGEAIERLNWNFNSPYFDHNKFSTVNNHRSELMVAPALLTDSVLILIIHMVKL